MSRSLDDKSCKDIIKYLANKLGIEPKLIVTRLMSEDDKNDLRYGLLTIKTLELHIRQWMKAGCPDYAHGLTESMEKPPVPI